MWHPKMERALLMQRLTCMRSMIRTPTGEPLTFSKNLNAKSGRLNWTKETGKMPVVRVPLSIKTTFASTLLEWQFASSYLKSHLRQTVPIGQKRKRGRPNKARSALQKD